MFSERDILYRDEKDVIFTLMVSDEYIHAFCASL